MRPTGRRPLMFCSRTVCNYVRSPRLHQGICQLTAIAEVRESLKGQEYSFTEIAKTVGEKWQVLPPDEKAGFESRSQAMKDHYYTQLAEYKKTQDYADYQRYLVDFKAKHEPRSMFDLQQPLPISSLTYHSRKKSERRLAGKSRPTRQRR